MDIKMMLPVPIKLEEASDSVSEIIDLDERTSSEDVILEWCTKVRMKFKNFFDLDNERSLDILMKWYIQTFKEDAMNIDESEAVKTIVFKHLQFFKLFFQELDCAFADNYLDNMEDLLAIYSDLEAKCLPKKQNEPNKRAYKKLISKVCYRIFEMANAYLMYREDRIYHVLMKIKLNIYCEETKDLLNVLYGKTLTQEPKNKSDLAFCRAYILYQKWKKLRKSEEWERMDEVMYKMYGRTPDSLKTNSTLQQILLPQSESILDVLDHISDNYTVVSEEYFKFIKLRDSQEDSLVSLDAMNIVPEENMDMPVEDEDFETAYNSYVETCPADSASVKLEQVAEECLIVGIGTLDCEPNNTELVHEVIDDEDDDIVDIIFFEGKKPKTSEAPAAPSSFLDSIDISPSREPTPPPPPSPPVASRPTSHASATTPPPAEDSAPSPVFVVPSRKPPRNRKKLRQLPKLKKKILLRKLTRRRRLARKLSNNNCKDAAMVKSVNHIETQTDFAQHGEPEDIYKRFKGLVTPPSDEHHEDHDDIHIAESSNVYAGFIRSGSTEEEGAYMTSSNDKPVLLEKSEELDNKCKESCEDKPTNDSSSSFYRPSSSEQPKRVVVSNTTCTSSDFTSDFSPSSSTASTKNSTRPTTNNDSYTSPASPDISSTSHDNYTESLSSTTQREADEEVGMMYGLNSISDGEDEDCAIQNDGSESIERVVNEDSSVEAVEEMTHVGEMESSSGIVHSSLSITDDCVDALTQKIDTTKGGEKDFNKFEKVLHQSWNSLLSSHDLDNILSGPIKKVGNACINPDKTFDLFENNTPPPRDEEVVVSQTPTSFSSATTTTSEMTSPSYETMDDFQSYLNCFRDTTNSTGSNGDGEVLGKTLPVTRKKRIVFANSVIDTPSPPHSPCDATNPASIHGILKKHTVDNNSKPKVRTRPLIPRRLMNMKSLARYHVPPSDPCLQSVPCVVLESLCQTEIDRWLRMSEISRRARLQRSQNSSSFRVFYDKSTSGLNKNDFIHYYKPEEQQWRAGQAKEGTVATTGTYSSTTLLCDDGSSSSSDYGDCTPMIRCTKACCCCCGSLATQLGSLSGARNDYETILNLSCDPNSPVSQCQNCPNLNPFASSSSKVVAKRKKRKLVSSQFESDYFHVAGVAESSLPALPPDGGEVLDLNVVTSIVESFDTKSDDFCLNSIAFDNKHVTAGCSDLGFDLDSVAMAQQPAVVPELEDFEKSLKGEELTKAFPSDLRNLKLNRFTPSPLPISFSPRSNSPAQVLELNALCSRQIDSSSDCHIPVEGFPTDCEQGVKRELLGDVKSELKLADSNSVLEGEEPEVRLPLKKRKLSVANAAGEDGVEDFIGPDLVEEILKRARAERLDKEDISYPAKPAMTIAEVQETMEPQPRAFKTAAENKEMPPPPPSAAKARAAFLEAPPKIVTEQYNNHTYDNPTINYHMNYVPYSFLPCASLSYFPPILLPTFDMNLVPPKQQQPQQQQQSTTMASESLGRQRREKRSKRKKRE